MYNGDIVGPTIRVTPGQTFTVTVVNNLPAPGFDTSALHNQFKTFDITNLHTHGLHVSSEAPGRRSLVPHCRPPALLLLRLSAPAGYHCVTPGRRRHLHGGCGRHLKYLLVRPARQPHGRDVLVPSSPPRQHGDPRRRWGGWHDHRRRCGECVARGGVLARRDELRPVASEHARADSGGPTIRDQLRQRRRHRRPVRRPRVGKRPRERHPGARE